MLCGRQQRRTVPGSDRERRCVQGQPALLYLVPCTLGLTLILAKARGDLRAMWAAALSATKPSEVPAGGPSAAERGALLPQGSG